MQDFRSHDSMCVESLGAQVICMFTNFIESQSSSCVIYSSPEKMVLLKNCNFISTKILLFNKVCEFVDCLSDGAYTQYMSTTTSGALTGYKIFFDKGVVITLGAFWLLNLS